jgi:hypothetical protein
MSLKIYENLFTGPFNINTYQYKKNKKASIILIVLKEGKNYAPTFFAVKIKLTDKKDIFSFEECANIIKKKFNCESIELLIYFREFEPYEESKRVELFNKINEKLMINFKIQMDY